MAKTITQKEAEQALRELWFTARFKDMKPLDYQCLYRTLGEIESGGCRPARILEVYKRLIDPQTELALITVKRQPTP